ncbi:MBL fold metallo-hydrolase [Deinococcus maricopensis]|uniref:Beta-lactamase domain protein n=1 Tax=Deinococcus maricopensis (strain DSM 21211 / LMG 22137 / NRRL B-23946 / LB-34) TaxID=709986 RepID=E8U415_DEIML|nr:MBL fold metallo-hydrolase [Deinococcus maricopensis]ADV65852.1 beta-lactamase domain protein [Deinococcus maricopensis DSM 21211]
MLLHRLYDDDLAQASYLIGCPDVGVALVVDPHRDVQAYLDLARQHSLRITHVTETHLHADLLSGARELSARAHAELHLSAEGGPDWTPTYPHTPLHHGDTLHVGYVRVQALHTPGHTPEHLSFLITDRHGDTALLTGDFVFVGDVGRPDLLDEAAGGHDTRFTGARQLFGALRDHFLPLPPGTPIWPGHGAGSACGKALGTQPSSTVGAETQRAWWAPYVARNDEDGFTRTLLADQPDAPAYFARMKRDNRAGPPLTPSTPLPALPASAVLDGLLIDTRPRGAYHAGSLPNALHLPDGPHLETWAAWLIDPDADPRPLVLLARDAAHAHALRARLWRVGLDRVAGYVTDLHGLPTRPYPPLPPGALPHDAALLDVRTTAEHAAGHLPGALLRPAAHLTRDLQTLPRDTPVTVYCQSGARSAAAASLLRTRGFADVRELAGGYAAWTAAHP